MLKGEKRLFKACRVEDCKKEEGRRILGYAGYFEAYTPPLFLSTLPSARKNEVSQLAVRRVEIVVDDSGVVHAGRLGESQLAPRRLEPPLHTRLVLRTALAQAALELRQRRRRDEDEARPQVRALHLLDTLCEKEKLVSSGTTLLSLP